MKHYHLNYLIRCLTGWIKLIFHAATVQWYWRCTPQHALSMASHSISRGMVRASVTRRADHWVCGSWGSVCKPSNSCTRPVLQPSARSSCCPKNTSAASYACAGEAVAGVLAAAAEPAIGSNATFFMM